MTADKGKRRISCNNWEKDRRNKLNESFNTLTKLLPCYDPSIPISKIDILTKSAEYIEKLKAKVDDCLHVQSQSQKLEYIELKELQVRVDNLITRNEQLVQLLKESNIRIPPECDHGMEKRQSKVAQKKTSPDKLEAQKENQADKGGLECNTQLVDEVHEVQNTQIKEGNLSQPVVVTSASVGGPKFTITNVQPVQPYYIISNNMTQNISPATTVVKNVISAPILSTSNEPTKQFAGGIILSVVQPQTLVNPPVIVNAAASNNTLFMLKSSKTNINVNQSNAAQSSESKRNFAMIKPKYKKRRLTKGKGAKVAIPAHRYDSSSYLRPNVQPTFKRRTKSLRMKRKKVDTNNKQTVREAVGGKKMKLTSEDKANSPKKINSDYSIDTLCKDNENSAEVNIKDPPPPPTLPPQIKTACKSQTQQNMQDSNTLTVDNGQSLQNVVTNKMQFEQKQIEANCTQHDQMHQKLQNQIPKSNVIHPRTLQSVQEKPITNSTQIPPAIQQRQQVQNQIHTSIPHAVAQLHDQQELNLHSELSNDIFATLQVQGSQNPESTSPTAAFLNAFPLVSSFTGVKVSEVMEEETTSPHGTPTLLQIGNLETTQKVVPNSADNLTPSIMNLDNFNFFNNSLYNNFENLEGPGVNLTTAAVVQSTTVTVSKSKCSTTISKSIKPGYDNRGNQNENPHNNVIKNYRLNDKKHLHLKAANTNSSIGNNTQNNCNTSNPETGHQMVSKQVVYNNLPTSQQQTFYDNNQGSTSARAVVSSGINFNATSNRYPEYNTFNPFELPKTTQSFVKNYNESTYVNNSCNYNYQTSDYNYHLGKNNYYETNNCNVYNGNLNTTNGLNINNTNASINAKRPKDNKSMVNWMAPQFPTASTSVTAKVTSYSSEFNHQNNYLTTNPHYAPDYQSSTNVAAEEHQFSWSPTKLPQLLDPTHNFPPTTLPTLVGDLALGTTTPAGTPQAFDKKKQGKKPPPNFEAGNFLSVSQLVDHNKDAPVPQPQTARITNRRNSGSRTVNKPSTKNTPKRNIKEKDKNTKMYELDWDTKRNKNPISSYSAESLIGAKQQNYPKTIPPYIPDNLIPYFPHNIDENFSQNNQNYHHQNNSFPSNYNNTFMPSTTNTTYLPTNNFMPDIFDNPIENIFSHSNSLKNNGTSGNVGEIKHKSPQKPKDVQFGSTAPTLTPANTTKAKNSKKKDSLVDLGFLSMPSMNSPLLPDDYHTNFLPPPPPPNHNQLYSSCKNPLYKQTSGGDLSTILPLGGSTATTTTNRGGGIQHAEIPPPPASLTNFNLCTIFPEMNRSSAAVPDVFKNLSGNLPIQKSVLLNLE